MSWRGSWIGNPIEYFGLHIFDHHWIGALDGGWAGFFDVRLHLS
jgi:hypothetical protein